MQTNFAAAIRAQKQAVQAASDAADAAEATAADRKAVIEARDIAVWGAASVSEWVGAQPYATWAALSAVTGAAGDKAVILQDAGTHTDPVTSTAGVVNEGLYVWSASPAGWKRIADTPEAKSQAWAEGTLPGGAGTKSAKEHAEDSATSAATAEAASGPTYASTAAGLAATTSGEAFAVDAGGGLVSVYLNSSGTAVLQRTLATTGELAASGGSALVGHIASGTGAVARTVQSKLRDTVATQDFTSHAVADAAGVELYNPANVTSTRANGAAVVANQWGPGRVTTADGNKRGKWFSNITAAPSALGNHDSIETAFNGDLSHSIFQIEHRITGAATLGQPTTGYTYTPEAYPFYGVLYNSSGYNHSTTGNGGRTGAAFSRINVKQYGQGDAVAYNASGFVASQKAGATHFLAQPAVVLFNGDAGAGADYIYLNPRELALYDNGYDVACIGDVINMKRTNVTGGQSCWWGGYRVQSNGSQPIDNVLSLVGKARVGLDFAVSSTNFGPNQAAISMKAGQRIYGNNFSTNGNYTDGFNGDYLEYTSGISGWNFVVGGTSRLQVNGSQLTAVGIPVVAPNFRAYAATVTAGAGQLAIGTTTATTATAGANGGVPSRVAGYLVMSLSGTTIKVPYYAN